MTPDASPGIGSRLHRRALDRHDWLGRMRQNILTLVIIVAAGQFLMTAIWLGFSLSGNEDAARGWGLMSVFMNLAITLVIVFLTWIVLEALGRIDREADRVQQLTDNVYRRL